MPIPADRIDAAVERIDGVVRDLIARTGVPGVAIAVVHDDKLVHAAGFGVRRLGGDEAVDEHTVFQLASVSKPISATVVARAVDEGHVSWDDPSRDTFAGSRSRTPSGPAT